MALVPPCICAFGWRAWVFVQHFQGHWRKGPSNQTPLVSWDPTAFIALVDDTNDLPILFHFRKVSRPCAAVGYLSLLARWLSWLHRPLSLVAVARSHCDVEVWDYCLCPGYVLLDFQVIQFWRLILTYRIGGQPFEECVKVCLCKNEGSGFTLVLGVK